MTSLKLFGKEIKGFWADFIGMWLMILMVIGLLELIIELVSLDYWAWGWFLAITTFIAISSWIENRKLDERIE